MAYILICHDTFQKQEPRLLRAQCSSRCPITKLTGSREGQCFSGWGPWLEQKGRQKGRQKWTQLHEQVKWQWTLRADPSQPGVAKEDDPLHETWAKPWLKHTGKNRKGLREEMCLLLWFPSVPLNAIIISLQTGSKGPRASPSLINPPQQLVHWSKTFLMPHGHYLGNWKAGLKAWCSRKHAGKGLSGWTVTIPSWRELAFKA
jgi:hypothetical protein